MSSRLVRSSISTPALAANSRSASGNDSPSRSMTKLKMSPPLPQPKQCHDSRPGVATKEGVFSPWNGHRPLYVVPAFLRLTLSPTTSTTDNLLLTSAVAPTDKLHSLLAPRTRRCVRILPVGPPAWSRTHLWAC